MSLQQRIKKIEDQARPLAKDALTERRRSFIGRFSMCKLMCYGFTHAEALDILAESNRRMGAGPIKTWSHFTAPHITAFFQSFLDGDSRAARLHKTLTAYRSDGVKWADTIESNHEQIMAVVTQLLDRMEAYFMEHHRADFLDFKAVNEKGRRLLAARNEQSETKNQENRNGP